jgi:hypothetical protein
MIRSLLATVATLSIALLLGRATESTPAPSVPAPVPSASYLLTSADVHRVCDHGTLFAVVGRGTADVHTYVLTDATGCR